MFAVISNLLFNKHSSHNDAQISCSSSDKTEQIVNVSPLNSSKNYNEINNTPLSLTLSSNINHQYLN